MTNRGCRRLAIEADVVSACERMNLKSRDVIGRSAARRLRMRNPREIGTFHPNLRATSRTVTRSLTIAITFTSLDTRSPNRYASRASCSIFLRSDDRKEGEPSRRVATSSDIAGRRICLSPCLSPVRSANGNHRRWNRGGRSAKGPSGYVACT